MVAAQADDLVERAMFEIVSQGSFSGNHRKAG